MQEQATKRCPACGESKPATFEFFYRTKSKTDGLQTYCRPCFNAKAIPHIGKAQRRSLELAAQGAVTEKNCRGCGRRLPLSAFSPNARKYYGVASRCRECAAAKEQERRDTNGDEIRASARQKNRETRLAVLRHYSGAEVPACACCGATYFPHLTLDHIAQDGAHQRRELKLPWGSRFYSWLKQHDYPDGLRVLCFNCNVATYREPGGCKCKRVE